MGSDEAPLNFLRAFDSAGKHLSFKLAAEELFISPPAVSHQIKALEERLGVQLFVRNNRMLSFTPAGEDYWRRVHDLLVQIDVLTLDLLRGYGHTTLLASIIPSLSSSLVIPNLGAFQEANPNIDIRIDSSTKNVSLEEGKADVVIRYGKGDWPNLVSEPLLDLYMQPIYPKHFAEIHDFSTIDSAANLPMVHNDGNPDGWHRWIQASGMKQPQPEHEFHFSDYPAAIEAAKTLGGTIAVMPVENYLLRRGLVIAPFPRWGPVEEKIYAVYRPTDQDKPAISIFIEWVKTLLAGLESD